VTYDQWKTSPRWYEEDLDGPDEWEEDEESWEEQFYIAEDGTVQAYDHADTIEEAIERSPRR